MAAPQSRWSELMRTMSASGIPSEMVVEILSKLPVKSILRFKSACKTWLALFGDPKFIELNTRKGIANKKECYLLRHLSFPEEVLLATERTVVLEAGMLPANVENQVTGHLLLHTSQGYYFYRDIFGEIYSLQDKKSFAEIGRFRVPIQSKTYYYAMVESMNGVICLIESDYQARCPQLNMFLWNPATREFKTLPRFFVNRFTDMVTVAAIGFAYHPRINDYKAVRIVFYPGTKTFEAEVFSLNADCWRQVDVQLIDLFFQDVVSKAYVNGALHWTQYKENQDLSCQYFILSFDLCTDKFNKTELPISYSIGYDLSLHQAPETYSGYLALVAHNPFECCDIWIMKEYRVATSWVKQYTIGEQQLGAMIPLSFFDDGSLVCEMGHNSELILYDPGEVCVRTIPIFAPASVFKYIESLVPLKADRRLNWYPSEAPPLNWTRMVRRTEHQQQE